MKKQLTPEQVQASKERKEKFQTYVKQVSALSDEQRAELAAKTFVRNVDGHTLSPTNQILIAFQFANATVVGGFRQWITQKRVVCKGQHGISIWVPALPKKANDEQPDAGTKDLHFFMGTVFDISQTEPMQQ